MAKRDNRFLLKRSNIPNKVPNSGDLLLGELALNTADAILYTSGTTQGSILPIGWDRISRTGDTVTGDFIINGDLTVTGNTNLGSISATSVDTNYIDFNTTYTGGTIEGRLHWDIDNGGPTIGMEGGNVSQQIGQETYYYIKNQSGATIENGRVVKAVGTVGASGKILGEYMIADGSVPPRYTLGIATEDILNGADGFVTQFGLVRGFDTTGTPYGETWNDGDLLWVSPTIDGGLTNVQPTVPNFNIEMAIVILANANGSIFVRPHRYPHFHDLQEANWVDGAESNLDIIQWNGSTNSFDLTSTPTFNSVSATTLYGDGSNLTNITATWSGQEVITVGETVVAGNLLYLGSGSTYLKVSNTSETTSSTELRIAVSGITSGSTGQGLIQGKFTTTGLTAGDKYWLGANGNFTNIKPSGDGDILRYIGTALDSTTLEFMPDETWVELASSSGPGTQPLLRNVTTSSGILITDYTINVSTTGNTTQTLPSAIGIIGKIYNIKNSDTTTTSSVTLVGVGGQTLDGETSIIFQFPVNITVQSDGSNWILI
jgi:hypothetical protein